MILPSPMTNPVHAKLLQETLPQVLPERRLRVAAEILGCSVLDILKAAEIPTYKAYPARKADRYDQHLLPLSKALGIAFENLWDEEALESPRKVIACLNKRIFRKPRLVKAAS